MLQLHHVTSLHMSRSAEVSGDKLVSIQGFVIPQNPKPESVKRWPPTELAPNNVAYRLGSGHRIHWIEGETNTSSETAEIQVDVPFFPNFNHLRIDVPIPKDTQRSTKSAGIRLDEMIRPGRLTFPGTDSAGCAGCCSVAGNRSDWVML